MALPSYAIMGIARSSRISAPVHFSTLSNRRIIDLSIQELLSAYKSKAFGVTEAIDSYIAQQDKYASLNALITTTHTMARTQAQLLDRDSGECANGKLRGIPIAVKDNFCTKVFLCTPFNMNTLEGILECLGKTSTSVLVTHSIDFRAFTRHVHQRH